MKLRDAVKALFQLYQDAGSRREGFKQAHRADFRASSSGICHRDVTLTAWAKGGTGRAPRELWRLESLLYVAIGTAVHETTQAYLGLKQILYGSWECTHCKQRWFNQLSPGEHCGAMPRYIEYALVHPDTRIGVDGEYGHCDGIGILPMNFGWYVIEIKTSSTRQCKIRMKEGPFKKHTEQASIYVDFFESGYFDVRERGEATKDNHRGEVLWTHPGKLPPGKCRGILFVYMPRDNPAVSEWAPLMVKPQRGAMLELEKAIPKVHRMTRKGVLPKGQCKVREDAQDEFGKWCVWTETCFSPVLDVSVQHMYSLYKANRKKN